MDGISHGHAYASSGPQIQLTARNERGESAMMGDLLGGSQLEFAATWAACADGDCLRVIVNGEPREEIQVGESGQHAWMLNAATDRWCALELRGNDGEMRAITNPIRMGAPDDWR
jgi:hypothetical protein